MKKEELDSIECFAKEPSLVTFDKLPKEEQDNFRQSFFEDLTETQQGLIYDLFERGLLDKYGVLVPSGVKTHTIVLENGLGCIINNPNASIMGKVLNKISAFSGDIDMVGAGRIILDNCWVCGDSELETNENYRLAAAMQCIGVVEVIQGRLKKN